MNGNLILVSIFLLLTTSFKVNANPGWSDCSFSAIDAPIMDATLFGPDPIGPVGTTLQVNVTQSLSKPTTTFTKLIIEFTDVNAIPIGYTRHPLDAVEDNIEDTFFAVVPQFLPDKYLIRVM
ncbi:37379_t:CDS:1, partial [Gigaspora margarita]